MSDSKQSYEFVMGFVAASDEYRQQYIDRWREVVANFMVEPQYGEFGSGTTPYRQGRIYTARRHQVVLKDPETHKIVMTYASKLVRTLFGSRDREYIKAKPRGWEDAAGKAQTVSRLLRYNFALPGHFRTFVEAVVDMLLFGTSIIESPWKYQEREILARSVTSELGVETEESQRMRIPVYDDPCLAVVDVMDFYPDPTHYRMQDMAGCAKRFRMNSIEAKATGQFKQDAVSRAIGNIGKESIQEHRDSFRAGIDQPRTDSIKSQFKDMIGYEYWGDVPWEDDQGSTRRVITVLNNVVVRDDPWPLSDYALPFHTFIINPVQGRFYGISPAEVIRYDQDFADALKVLLAEAVIRSVHPPIAYDPDAMQDEPGVIAKLQTWKADAILAARGGPNAVGTLQYRFDANSGFGMLAGLKSSMQEGSGALGAIQGESGPDREAATVGAFRIQGALDRPELAAMVLENECLPPLGESLLRRYQQFLDTQGLTRRIGEDPPGVWIGDIMGDFDVEFVGSRMEMSRQEKLQSYDRLVALASAIPPLMMQIPWQDIGRDLVGDTLELPEVAVKIGNQQQMLMNALLQQVGGGSGPNKIGSAPRAGEPPGLMPAQASGGGA